MSREEPELLTDSILRLLRDFETHVLEPTIESSHLVMRFAI